MNNSEMKACIDACLACYQTCIGMASTHCLEEGGEHVEPMHFRTMLTCAEICRSCAHIMLLRLTAIATNDLYGGGLSNFKSTSSPGLLGHRGGGHCELG